LTRMRGGTVLARFFAGAPDVSVIGREPPARGGPGRVNALQYRGCNGAYGPLPSVMWTICPQAKRIYITWLAKLPIWPF
jgi:hypothetical protein